MTGLSGSAERNVCLLAFAAAVTLMLLLGAAADRTRRRPFMRYFIVMLAAALLTLLGETGLWLLAGNAASLPWLYFCAAVALEGGAVVGALYAYCLVGYARERRETSERPARAAAAAAACLCLLIAVSLFNGCVFSFGADGVYHAGPLHFLVKLTDLGMIGFDLCLVARYRDILSVRGMLMLMSFGFLPLLAAAVLPGWYPVPAYAAAPLSFILIYLLFHGELTRQLAKNERRLAESERKLAENERKLTESRIAAVLSQIQPHFIYNTLGTIEYFCRSRPETAGRLVHSFALYLRGCFGELDNPRPIPFSSEMEHVRHYLEIEQIRFPDMEVRFDLRAEEFRLPALSVQPLVENAVRHGLMGLESGGTVRVSSYETDRAYCVSVTDNGVGFDPSADAGKCVGLNNIRGRLEAVCGGTLRVTSSPGRGTAALIEIPKREGTK